MSAAVNQRTAWEETARPVGHRFVSQDSITTEDQPRESPEWPRCLNALLNAWLGQSFPGDTSPNELALAAAINGLRYLRTQFPTAPPTCIIPEPSGGVIVERRMTCPQGHESVCELAFYNDGRAERTDYFAGRVVSLAPLSRAQFKFVIG